MNDEKEPTCVGCGRTTVLLRESTDDGKLRCRLCRTLHLERLHGQPVRPVPASVGEQSRMGL